MIILDPYHPGREKFFPLENICIWLWIVFPPPTCFCQHYLLDIYWILYSLLVSHITWLLTKKFIVQQKQWLMAMRLTGLTMYHVIQKPPSWWNGAMVHRRNSQLPAGRTTQPMHANNLQVWRDIWQDLVYVLITTATNTWFCFCDCQDTGSKGIRGEAAPFPFTLKTRSLAIWFSFPAILISARLMSWVFTKMVLFTWKLRIPPNTFF